MTQPQSNNSASGSQPGLLPVLHRLTPDLKHYHRGRWWDKARTKPYGPPTAIVVHSTVSGCVTCSSAAWLSTAAASEVSCHALVNRGGSRTDIVAPMDTAYHAGSCIAGIGNTSALGLEIENMSNGGLRVEPYSAAMINTSAHVVAGWCYSFGIPWERVLRHGDVAVFPPNDPLFWRRGKLGRKSDPVNFDWADFERRCKAWLLFFSFLPTSEHKRWII